MIICVKHYVEQGGTKCPVCQSDQIQGGFVEIDAGTANQEIECLACPATWTDRYKLTGYTDLEKNK